MSREEREQIRFQEWFNSDWFTIVEAREIQAPPILPVKVLGGGRFF